MDEQIFVLLQQMQQDMKGMQQEMRDMRQQTQQQFQSMQQEMRDMREELTERIDAVDTKVDAVDEKVTKTQLVIETELRPNISLLAEGYGPLANDMRAVRETVEVSELRLEIVEKVVRRNSEKIDAMEHVVYAS